MSRLKSARPCRLSTISRPASCRAVDAVLNAMIVRPTARFASPLRSAGMHFDAPRTAALRELASSKRPSSGLRRGGRSHRRRGRRPGAFFDGRETVHSDMVSLTAPSRQEHTVEYCDLLTHADDIRGYRASTPGRSGRGRTPSSEEKVELSLGPTVHGRVRFAADEDAL